MMTRVSRSGPDARLAKYHPVRFYLLRDDKLWNQAVESRAAAIEADRAMSLLGAGELLYFKHVEGLNLLSGLEEYTFPRERLERAFAEEYGSANNNLETAVQQWHGSGQQIFDISAISAMFLGSDSMKTPVGRVKLPYESFYIHWGRHLELPSPIAGRFVEGCYVSRLDGVIDLTFVTSLPDNDPWDQRSLLANLVIDGEGVSTIMLTTEEDGTIGDEASMNLDTGFTNEPFVLRWKGLILSAVNMAANCLCYLSSQKAEIEESYPSEAPVKLVQQASSGTIRDRRRGVSKLETLGFRMVKLCGRGLAESLGLKQDSKEMPAHWRKGHWWPARIGKGRTEVRMDWRDGVVVNADKGAPPGGHIYTP
jgi:hypothetical protein